MPKEMRARTKKRMMMMIAIVSFCLTILAVDFFCFLSFRNLSILLRVWCVSRRTAPLEWKAGGGRGAFFRCR